MNAQSEDWRADRLQAAREGRNPTVLAELTTAFAVVGDVQFLPGYCVVLSKTAGADRISDLSRPERIRHLADVDLVATAVETVCSARDSGYKRVNVEILGNAYRHLHAHVWPRYDWEPPERQTRPVWLYPADRWSDPSFALGPAQDELRSELAAEVLRLRGLPEFELDRG